MQGSTLHADAECRRALEARRSQRSAKKSLRRPLSLVVAAPLVKTEATWKSLGERIGLLEKNRQSAGVLFSVGCAKRSHPRDAFSFSMAATQRLATTQRTPASERLRLGHSCPAGGHRIARLQVRLGNDWQRRQKRKRQSTLSVSLSLRAATLATFGSTGSVSGLMRRREKPLKLSGLMSVGSGSSRVRGSAFHRPGNLLSFSKGAVAFSEGVGAGRVPLDFVLGAVGL